MHAARFVIQVVVISVIVILVVGTGLGAPV